MRNKKRIILSIVVMLFLISSLALISSLPIYVRPLSNGKLLPSQTFYYQFNFTSNSDCSGVIISFVIPSLTTDRYGIGFVDLDISNITSVPSYLCEYRGGNLRKIHSLSDIIFDVIHAQNLNISENIKADGNVTASSGVFSWLGSLLDRITGLFVQDINFNGTINGSGNISISGYYSGQPIDGSIGSGIINSSSNNVYCGCVNASDMGGLNVWYPDLKVRIWNFGQTIYCDITGTTVAVPDDAHTVYYVDSACTVQTDTWANYFAQDLNPSNWARIFDVYTRSGDIEVLKGSTIIGLVDRKTKWVNVNCGTGGHLSVCDGMDITEGIFPEINMSAGHFNYIHTVVTSQQRDSNPDGLHVTCYSDGSHTAETEIDIDKCDNGASCNACPDNKYRRYLIYDIGWGTDHAKIHQLAPVDGDTFTTLANCLNTEKNPLSYTLPADEEDVAVILAFYCGKRDDTVWGDGWVDLRAGTSGFGASPDLSGFMTYAEWSQNANANNYNLTGGDYLQFTTLNITENMTVDTDTLFVDSDNDRVGIGTTSPSHELNVVGDANITGLIYGNGSQLTGIGVPTGTILIYGAATAPTGWLLCNGSAISRTTYSDLFAVIGTTYGVGDGSTTFNVPNFASKFPRGVTAGATGGSDDAIVVSHSHTFTGSALPTHRHYVTIYKSTVGMEGGGGFTTYMQQYGTQNNYANYVSAGTPSGTISSEGSSGTGANIPAYLGVNFIIKY